MTKAFHHENTLANAAPIGGVNRLRELDYSRKIGEKRFVLCPSGAKWSEDAISRAFWLYHPERGPSFFGGPSPGMARRGDERPAGDRSLLAAPD